MAKGKTIELYTDNIQQRENWIIAMKRFVVLLDLKEEFSIGRLLGRGNFAKVHLCTRKTDPTTKYALKTMQKSMFMKTKRNIVSQSRLLILHTTFKVVFFSCD